MKRTITFLAVLVALGAVAAGAIYVWANQQDAAELNQTLPDGISVRKSWVGSEYTVVNKIDGYEFKVPSKWQGISKINYVPEKSDKGYSADSLGVEGKTSNDRIATINLFRDDDETIDLKTWAQNSFTTFGLIGNFIEDKIGNFMIVKTTEDKHLLGMSVFFFRANQKIVSITNGSEEFIKEIILSGKW